LWLAQFLAVYVTPLVRATPRPRIHRRWNPSALNGHHSDLFLRERERILDALSALVRDG